MPSPPANLSELAALLRASVADPGAADPRLAEYCDQWADTTDELRRSDLEQMDGFRGNSHEILEERSSIYFDLVETLSAAADHVDQENWAELEATQRKLTELLAELTISIQDMARWLSSEEHRCLSCGWSTDPPSPEVCPSCHVHCLRPVRRPVEGSLSSQPAPDPVGQKLQAVLQGRADVHELEGLWRGLPAESDRDGVALMRRGIDERDAQLLQEGWARLAAG